NIILYFQFRSFSVNIPELFSLDLEEGKEGGSWLGISKRGKLAALTNYLEAWQNPDAQGRGFLVSNYLTDNLDSFAYLRKVSSEAHLYNGFNLLTADFRNTPDHEQESQGVGFSKAILQALSAVCVRSPGYGTRTNTVILIDREGNVSFTERTMLNCDITQWSTNSFHFKLQE
uniref:Transport and Golgi organization protein 2 homolog n=1 Tax=Sinocyclocheilus rhinocerous TaxID=307959 RepID=A0A673MUW9_9TELE